MGHHFDVVGGRDSRIQVFQGQAMVVVEAAAVAAGPTTGGCMSKGTKKAKIHHFSGYASNFKSSIYVIKLLKTNSSR